MKISINLASRPFVELRPLFAKLRLAMVVLTLLALGLAVGLHSVSEKARAATVQMDELKARTAAFEQERANNEARMRQPNNVAVLERSQFLNALFARKSFSWTGVLMDLEHVLPAGVQVTSIDPGVSKEGEVSIRLRVTGDRDRAIQLVRNLERSQRFVAPRLGGESSLTADKAKALGGPNVSAQAVDQAVGNGVEFEIFSGYNPLTEKSGIGKTGARKAGPGRAQAATGKAASQKKKSPAKAKPVKVPAAGGGVR
jgi:type IV pilus assembly protein PilN